MSTKMYIGHKRTGREKTFECEAIMPFTRTNVVDLRKMVTSTIKQFGLFN